MPIVANKIIRSFCSFNSYTSRWKSLNLKRMRWTSLMNSSSGTWPIKLSALSMPISTSGWFVRGPSRFICDKDEFWEVLSAFAFWNCLPWVDWTGADALALYCVLARLAFIMSSLFYLRKSTAYCSRWRLTLPPSLLTKRSSFLACCALESAIDTFWFWSWAALRLKSGC